MAHTPLVLIASRLSPEEKWDVIMAFSNTPTSAIKKKKLHTLIRPITQQSSLIINDAASRVSEQVRPNPLALRLE